MPLYEVSWDYGHTKKRGVARVVADGPFEATLEAGRRLGKSGLNGDKRLERKNIHAARVDSSVYWADDIDDGESYPKRFEPDGHRSVNVSARDLAALLTWSKHKSGSFIFGLRKRLVATADESGGFDLKVYG